MKDKKRRIEFMEECCKDIEIILQVMKAIKDECEKDKKISNQYLYRVERTYKEINLNNLVIFLALKELL